MRQNQDSNLRLLKAQRHLYSLAKKYAFVNFLISIPLIIICSLIAKGVPSFEIWYGYISLAALVVGEIFRYLSDDLKEQGAQVQSMFDSNVLGVKTNNFLIGSKVSLEEIKRHADSISEKDNQKLRDWYPTVAATLPLAYGRIICQRANCYWNFTQRNRYVIGLYLLSLISIFFVIGLGISMAESLQDLLLLVVVPLLPIISWGVVEIISHTKSLKSLKNLKGEFEKIIEDILNKRLNADSVEIVGVQIQDALYSRRAHDPLVPGKIYWIFRDAQESEMQFSAETLVEQIRPTLHP